MDRALLYDRVCNGMMRLVTAASNAQMHEIKGLAVHAFPIFRQAIGDGQDSSDKLLRQFQAELGWIVEAIQRVACEEDHHTQENVTVL